MNLDTTPRIVDAGSVGRRSLMLASAASPSCWCLTQRGQTSNEQPPAPSRQNLQALDVAGPVCAVPSHWSERSASRRTQRGICF